MGSVPATRTAVRYFTHIVAELVAAGVAVDEIEGTVDMLLSDAHASHPLVFDLVIDEVRANTAAALAILRA